MFNTQFSIRLKPHGQTHPDISYGVDELTNTLTITQPVTLKFDVNLTEGNHKFCMQFLNKTNDTPDMAVEIESATFEGMTYDRFKWASRYYPIYPEPWASEQQHLEQMIPSATYLGWNGYYEIPFTVPIFTWIHQTENLGWIYS